MIDSKKNYTSTVTFSKAVLTALIVFVTAGQSHAQIFGKKKYDPVFEIPGRTFTASDIPLQSQYTGKIVFSDEKLTKANTTEDKFKKSFDLGSPIYSRVFTSNAVENYQLYTVGVAPGPNTEQTNFHGEYITEYYIDGELKFKSRGYNNRESGLSGVQSWQIFLNSTNAQESYDWKPNSIREQINKLTPGVHKVKMVIWPTKDFATSAGSFEARPINPIAEGEFDLNVKDGAKIKIGKSWKDLKNGAMASDTKIKSKLTELSAADMKNNQPDITVKEYKILSDDYSIQKEYNYPKFRYVQIAVYGTDKSGKCFIYYMMYAQDHAGGGSYSSNFYKWGHSNIVEVDCE